MVSGVVIQLKGATRLEESIPEESSTTRFPAPSPTYTHFYRAHTL